MTEWLSLLLWITNVINETENAELVPETFQYSLPRSIRGITMAALTLWNVYLKITHERQNHSLTHGQSMDFYLFIYLFYYFLFVGNFVIHWNETAMGLHVLPMPIPPPTSSPPNPSRSSQCTRSIKRKKKTNNNKKKHESCCTSPSDLLGTRYIASEQ